MLQFYINNQLADTGDDNNLDIKFNREFVDQTQIDARAGDYSYTIKLPKNNVNNTIFQHANILNVLDKFVKTEELQGKVIVDGMSSINGFVKLSKITEDGYEMALISNNVAWAKLIQGKNLDELTNEDGSTWEFIFTGSDTATTQYSFQWYNEGDNSSFRNSDILFPLIPRGYFFHSANTDSSHFYPDSLSILDIPPAVYEQKIIKKIFGNIGWAVDGDLFINEEHQKVFLPFCSNDKYGWNYLSFAHSACSGATEGVYYDYYRLGGSGTTFPYGQRISSFHYETPVVEQYGNQYPSNINAVWYEPNYTISNAVNLFNFRFNNISFTNQSGNTPGLLTGNEYFSSVDEVPFDINFNVTFTGLTYAGLYNTNHSHINYGQQFPNGWKRAVTMIYIHDDDYINEVLDDVSNYYQASVSAITHPNVIFAYDFLSSYYSGGGVTDIYFTPYSTGQEVSNQIPGDTTIINNLGIYQTSEIRGNGLNVMTFNVEHLRGDIQFQLRNIILLEGQYIRAMTVFPTAPFTETYTVLPLTRRPSTTAALYQVCDLFEFTPVLSAVTYSPNINIAQNLPQISQLDFMKDYISRNQLFISYNQDLKTVRFDTFNGFFLPNDHAVDITEQCDLKYGQPIITPLQLPRNIYFKYSNDKSDILLAQDMDYASLQITSDNVYTEGNQTISSMYSSIRTSDFRYFPGQTAGTDFHEFTLPTIITEQGNSIIDLTQIQWTFTTTQRILKDDGPLTDTSGNTIYIMVDNIPSKIRASRFEDTRSYNNLNLRFDTDNGLYYKYYDRYLSQIADSHVVEYNSMIDTNNFNELQPQYPVKVGNQHYFLNRISAFSPNKQQPTKIQLIKKFTN